MGRICKSRKSFSPPIPRSRESEKESLFLFLQQHERVEETETPSLFSSSSKAYSSSSHQQQTREGGRQQARRREEELPCGRDGACPWLHRSRPQISLRDVRLRLPPPHRPLPRLRLRHLPLQRLRPSRHRRCPRSLFWHHRRFPKGTIFSWNSISSSCNFRFFIIKFRCVFLINGIGMEFSGK